MSCSLGGLAFATQFGLVKVGLGMVSIWLTLPYFSRSSSIGPKSRARMGHDATQSGSWSFSRRSMHMVHLLIFVPGSSLANLGAP